MKPCNTFGRIVLVLLLYLFPLYLLSAERIDIIIPKPQKCVASKGHFVLNKQTGYSSDSRLAVNAIVYLQEHLKQSAGYRLSKRSRSKAALHFHYTLKSVKKAEGYRLIISKENIQIEARDSAGFFYGVVSLLQLMDPVIWGTKRAKNIWSIPSCNIEDYPRFKWRGLMLDSSRNFFSKSYVEKFIDRMAQHKLNRFHWHLTDDEGWRIEIKKYPLLTSVGAKRGPGTKLPFSTYPAMRGSKKRVQSGYYSQKDIREIVTYAKARAIEIIPEIDMPAHAKAALISYPKLLKDPQDKSRYRSVQMVSNNTLNPGMDSTYVFIDNVIAEVSRLFPFGYIHVGGDEVPKGAWKKSPAVVQIMQKKGLKNNQEVEEYFFTRVDKILEKHHKKMVTWQEVWKDKNSLRDKNIYMAWKSTNAAKKIMKTGNNVILAPVEYLYFDQQYRKSKGEPGHTWSTPVSTKKTYSFTPLHSSYVKGIEACLWSETLLNIKIADYLTWPRALALSEAAWTEQSQRQWKNFKKRVSEYGLPRLKVQGIHYRPMVR